MSDIAGLLTCVIAYVSQAGSCMNDGLWKSWGGRLEDCLQGEEIKAALNSSG